MYELVYEYYRTQEPHCIQLIVEDAADEFQKVMDICNMKTLASLYAGKLGSPATEAISLPPVLTFHDIKSA